jgi:hypothetical protein
MFNSTGGTLLAHKHFVIAAIAISGLVLTMFPITMMAYADHRPINIERNIQLRCLPYCQTAADVLGDGIDVPTNIVHVRIGFSFFPR